MDEPLDISSDQLARYVAGEADADERARVERWADAAPEHRRELEAMTAIWSLSTEPASDVDVDAAWNKLHVRMGRSGEGGRVIPLARNVALRWAAAAAVLVGLFLVARNLSSAHHELVATAQALSARLPDSTDVLLSPGSRLEARMGDERHIVLKGKAWFEVARDVRHPFVVETPDLRVTALGTGFEVNAYDTAAVWSVRVRHGRVRVETGDRSVELGAGERVSFDRKERTLDHQGPVTVEAWGDRIVQFQNAALREVTAELQRIYHVRIDLSSDALARCRLTATFEGEPIDQVLHVIAGTFGLRVARRAVDHYLLEGDGC